MQELKEITDNMFSPQEDSCTSKQPMASHTLKNGTCQWDETGEDLMSACRAFYLDRLEASAVDSHQYRNKERTSRGLKSSMSLSQEAMTINGAVISSKLLSSVQKNVQSEQSVEICNGNTNRTGHLAKTIENLRVQLSHITEQDLSLMKQLLTVNDQIEELKWIQKDRLLCRRFPLEATESDDVANDDEAPSSLTTLYDSNESLRDANEKEEDSGHETLSSNGTCVESPPSPSVRSSSRSSSIQNRSGEGERLDKPSLIRRPQSSGLPSSEFPSYGLPSSVEGLPSTGLPSSGLKVHCFEIDDKRSSLTSCRSYYAAGIAEVQSPRMTNGEQARRKSNLSADSGAIDIDSGGGYKSSSILSDVANVDKRTEIQGGRLVAETTEETDTLSDSQMQRRRSRFSINLTPRHEQEIVV